MNTGTMKQMIFDCAMELMYEQESYTKEMVADKLLYILREHDNFEKESRLNELNSKIKSTE